MHARIWRGMQGAALGLLVACAAACGSDESAPSSTGRSMTATAAVDPDGVNEAPSIDDVRLNPASPVPGQPLQAVVSSSDPDHDPVRLTITWLVNGRAVQVGTSPILAGTEFRSGDRVEVEVVASDGKVESEPYRYGSQTSNRTPVVRSVFLEPSGEIRAGQTLSALVDAADPDDDPLSFDYIWFVNGKERGDGEKNFSTEKLRRGDKIRVRVVARDGQNRSKAVDSDTSVLANAPPVFAGIPRVEAVGGSYRYQLEASDPDGDRSLRFGLEEGPDGMSVDPLSGVARWSPTASQAGSHTIQVVVRDGGGAETRLRWTVDVAVEQPPAAPR